MMKGAVGLAICTDGIEVTLLSYLVPCVAAEWGLSPILQGSLTASVFAGELVRACNTCIAGVLQNAGENKAKARNGDNQHHLLSATPMHSSTASVSYTHLTLPTNREV